MSFWFIPWREHLIGLSDCSWVWLARADLQKGKLETVWEYRPISKLLISLFYLPEYCNPIVTFIFNKINYIFILTLLPLVISVTFNLAAIYSPAWYHRQSKYLPSKVLCPLGCVPSSPNVATLQSWGTSFNFMLQGLLCSLVRWWLYLWAWVSLNGDQNFLVMGFQT